MALTKKVARTPESRGGQVYSLTKESGPGVSIGSGNDGSCGWAGGRRPRCAAGASKVCCFMAAAPGNSRALMTLRRSAGLWVACNASP